MKELMNPEVTMSSFDFLNAVINPARGEAGEPVVEYRHFLSRVEDEIDDLPNGKVFFTEEINNLGFNVRREKICYTLNMEQMTLVGMRESKSVRRSVLEKLKEMGKTAHEIPKTFAEALRLAADQQEQIALMAPKADVYDKIVDRNNLYNATQVAQKFGQSAVWMNKHLSELGVYNRAVKRGRAFQQWFVDKGYGIMRETESGHSQPMFYAEGEMWIIEKLTSEGLI